MNRFRLPEHVIDTLEEKLALAIQGMDLTEEEKPFLAAALMRASALMCVADSDGEYDPLSSYNFTQFAALFYDLAMREFANEQKKNEPS